MSDAILPFITVAMPVLNEARFIENTLLQLLAQDFPKDRYEIIVADGGSTDDTRWLVQNMARMHQQIILMDNPGRLPSSGRNVGFKYGKGDLFLVIDGHCHLPNNQLLRNVVDCFHRTGAHCLGRPQPFILNAEPTTQRAIVLARASWLGHSSNSYIHSKKEAWVSPVSMGCAYRKEIFEKIGFLDEAFDACEDVEFNYRVEQAGFNTFFSPQIEVYYYPRSNLWSLWKQMLRYGKGRLRFVIKHPAALNLEMLILPAFSSFFLFGPLVGTFSPFCGFIYILLVSSYVAIVSGTSLSLSRCYGWSFLLKLIAVFPTIHFGLGVGMMMEALRPFIRASGK